MSKKRDELPHLLIDGYNVIHAWPELKKEFKHGSLIARQALIERVRVIHDIDNIRLTIVFDGQGKETEVERPGKDVTLSIIYTASQVSADALIEALVQKAKHPEKITVATQDHGIADIIRSLGAFVVSPDSLRSWLERCESIQHHKLDKHRKDINQEWREGLWRDLQ